MNKHEYLLKRSKAANELMEMVKSKWVDFKQPLFTPDGYMYGIGGNIACISDSIGGKTKKVYINRLPLGILNVLKRKV